MITIKAFNKGLVCREFKYEIGKTYKIPKNDVKRCNNGFHASAHCDISETIYYYPISEDTEYALVDINVVYSIRDKVVGDKIKVIKKLKTLDELIEYDKTGEWCYLFVRYNAKKIKKDDVKKLQDAVLQKDKTGKLCYYFARNIRNTDINKLQDAIIEKDETGKWCTYFAINVKNTNIAKLEDAVIRKDETGRWCAYFAEDVDGANVKKLENMIIEKDKTGKWYTYFSENIVEEL